MPNERQHADARRRGEVALSPLLCGAAALGAGTATLLLGGDGGILKLARAAWSGSVAMHEVWGVLARLVGLPLLAAVGAALLLGLVQTRAIVVAPWRSVRSPRPTLVARVGWWAIALASLALALRPELDLLRAPIALTLALAAAGRIAVRMAGLLVLVGLVDWALRRAQLARRLEMSRAEIARQQRDEEGDPRLGSERRRRHRELVDPPRAR